MSLSLKNENIEVNEIEDIKIFVEEYETLEK